MYLLFIVKMKKYILELKGAITIIVLFKSKLKIWR